MRVRPMISWSKKATNNLFLVLVFSRTIYYIPLYMYSFFVSQNVVYYDRYASYTVCIRYLVS